MGLLKQLPVREVLSEDMARPQEWPFTLAPVRQLLDEGLELAELTVLVGANGAGKSTLVEAIALAYGLSPEGGSVGARLSTRASESELWEHLRLVRGAGASKQGYFLRAETLHSLMTYLEDNPPLSWEEQRFHEQSHGQAFHSLLSARSGRLYSRGGLLVLDEPEAGLSFSSQVELVQQLREMVHHGVQVLLATHSPVIAALPGARILQVDGQGFAPVAWQELEQVSLHRRFLADPTAFLG